MNKLRRSKTRFICTEGGAVCYAANLNFDYLLTKGKYKQSNSFPIAIGIATHLIIATNPDIGVKPFFRLII